jgi:predicted amidohydrolase
MARIIHLAIVQMHPRLGDLAANLAAILEKITETAGQGADLILFPELALTGYHPGLLGDRLLGLALDAADEPIQRLAQAGRRAGACVVAGFIEKGRIPGVVYNSIALCDPESAQVRTYAKSHLFSAENLHFRPGSKLEVWPTRLGKIGPMICMDIGYPEVARILGRQGAELLIAPSCWIDLDADIWPLHLQARALDNLAFVAGCNRVGSEGELNFIGQSMLVGPRGNILARLGDREDILYAALDLDEVPYARRRALHWTLRRPELYKPISEPEE